MSFKTEMHVHSKGISRCSKVSYEEIAENYIKAGYDTIVLTNHIVKESLERSLPGGTWKEWMEYYVTGIHDMKKAAGNDLEVLMGIEMRFSEGLNDYLLYGVTEEFLLKSDSWFEMGIENFYPFAKENNILVFQAHPFRDKMKVTPPQFLDGIEVFNGNRGRDSRNSIANKWADMYNLMKVSGSDYHYLHSAINAGIETEEKITDIHQLVAILKSGNYKLIRKYWRK